MYDGVVCYYCLVIVLQDITQFPLSPPPPLAGVTHSAAVAPPRAD